MGLVFLETYGDIYARTCVLGDVDARTFVPRGVDARTLFLEMHMLGLVFLEV